MMRLKAMAKGKRVKAMTGRKPVKPPMDTNKDRQLELLKRLTPQQIAALIRVLEARANHPVGSDR